MSLHLLGGPTLLLPGIPGASPTPLAPAAASKIPSRLVSLSFSKSPLQISPSPHQDNPNFTKGLEPSWRRSFVSRRTHPQKFREREREDQGWTPGGWTPEFWPRDHLWMKFHEGFNKIPSLNCSWITPNAPPGRIQAAFNYFTETLGFSQIIWPKFGFLPHHSNTGTSPETWEKQE